MTITGTHLTHANDALNSAADISTAVITPTVSRIYLACVVGYNTIPQPTSITGNSLAWAKMIDLTCLSGFHIGLWLGTGTPTAGAVTFHYGSSADVHGLRYSIDEFAGASGVGATGSQRTDGNSGSPLFASDVTASVTASTPLAIYGACFSGNANSAADVTPDGGFTVLSSAELISCGYDPANVTASLHWHITNAPDTAGAVVIELGAAYTGTARPIYQARQAVQRASNR